MKINGLGARVSVEMDKRGITKESLALEMEVSEKTIERIVIHNTIAKVQYLVQLSKILGVSLDWIVCGDKSNKDISMVKEVTKGYESYSNVKTYDEMEYLKREISLLQARLKDKDVIIKLLNKKE